MNISKHYISSCIEALDDADSLVYKALLGLGGTHDGEANSHDVATHNARHIFRERSFQPNDSPIFLRASCDDNKCFFRSNRNLNVGYLFSRTAKNITEDQ